MIEEYFNHLKELLVIEQTYEEQEYKQLLNTPIDKRVESGNTWFPVLIDDQSYTTSGKLIVRLKKVKMDSIESSFYLGNVVSFFKNSDSPVRLKGTISKISSQTMDVILDIEELPDEFESGKLGVDKFLDEYTYKEMKITLQKVLTAKSGRLVELRDRLIGKSKANLPDKSYAYKNDELNSSQVKAVVDILSCEDFQLVKGPPGTGKTMTLVYTIEELLKTEEQILVTAPSNTAVDVLCERLLKRGVAVTRIGNPSRISEELFTVSLEGKLTLHPDYPTVKKSKQEAVKLKRDAFKYKRNFGQKEREKRKMLLEEAKEVLKYSRDTEHAIIQSILETSQVLCATLVGCNDYILKDRFFPTVFIDESSQSLEPASWIPICKATRVIFSGDEFQLPPTVKSLEAAKEGLSETLFEKLIRLYPNKVSFLDTQYRMNQYIMNFSNTMFYEGRLKAAQEVKDRSYSDFCKTDAGIFSTPVLFIDTAGCDYSEKEVESSMSLYNSGEAELLRKIYDRFEKTNIDNSIPDDRFSVGILSPYKAQVEHLKEVFQAQIYKVDINTIDSFQGREMDILFISLVRSNDSSEVGFLSDIRRMNVAITRARLLLVVIGDSATISGDRFYADFISYCESEGFYKSAWEFIETN
jgi:ATP-dependent RNA/DNA helicase IGHMBP2